jgi:hypothetical protein
MNGDNRGSCGTRQAATSAAVTSEAPVGYVAVAVILIVLGATAFLVYFAKHESKLVPRQPSLTNARRTLRKNPRVVVSGDQCDCGGILGPSGRFSETFGPTLGCTGCDGQWTEDGRRIRTRAVRPRRSARPMV